MPPSSTSLASAAPAPPLSLPQRRSYRFEATAGCVITLLIAACLATDAVSVEALTNAWFIPFVGIAGATVAMSTPAGGGVVFFPTLVLLGIPPHEAVAFSVATQSIGMGVFGTYNWTRKDPAAILVPACRYVIPAGALGVVLALLVFPISHVATIRLFFSTFGLALALYLLASLRMHRLLGFRPFALTGPLRAVLLLCGVLGGLVVGYVGVGVDVFVFVALTAGFRTDTHLATVTSIVVMGFTAMVAFAIQFFVLDAVPLALWLMALPGILIGARLGPWLNLKLGRRRVIVFFSILLILEFAMTFARLFVMG